MGDKTTTLTSKDGGTSVSDESDVTGGLSVGAGTVGYTGNSSINANQSGSSIKGSGNYVTNTTTITDTLPDSDSSALDADLLLNAGKNMESSGSGNPSGSGDPSPVVGSNDESVWWLILLGLVLGGFLI
jgi:hypothetical protein